MALLEMNIEMAAHPVRDPFAAFHPPAVDATERGVWLAWMPRDRAKVLLFLGAAMGEKL
jgi:hypothetical protein